MSRVSKLLILICLASGLFLTAAVFQWTGDGSNAVSRVAADVTADIRAIEDAQPLLPAADPWKTWKITDLVAIEKKAATFLGYSPKDSLIAWTKPGSFDLPREFSRRKDTSALMIISDRKLLYLRSFPASSDSTLRWVGYLPLEIPAGLAFSTTSGESQVSDPNGRPLGFLYRLTTFQTAASRNLVLSLWLISMVAVLLAAATLARYPKTKRSRSWRGFLIIGGLSIVVVAVSAALFGGNAFFQPAFFRSFPLQFLMSAAALTVAVFWQNEVGPIGFIPNVSVPVLLSAGLIGVNIFGAGLEGEIWSQWPFWNVTQWGYLIAYGLWWTAFFLAAYRLYRDWVLLEPRYLFRIASWFIFTLVSGTALGLFTAIPVFRFILFAFSFGICMDYFIVSRVGNLTGFGFWLFVLSLGSAIFTIDPRLSSVADVVSRFSYLFVLLLLLVLALMGLHALSKWLDIAGPLPWKNADSLRTRLQRLVVSVTLVALGLTSMVSYIFVHEETSSSFYRILGAEINGLSLSWKKEYETNWTAFAALAEGLEWDLLYFDGDGRLKNVALAVNKSKTPSIQYMHPLARLAGKNPRPVAYSADGDFRILYRQLPSGGYLGMRVPEGELHGRTPGLLNFIRLLTNICVFLFLMTGVISIFLANSLVEPLVRLGKKLRTLTLESNEPLEWNRQDEIGSLVDAYNQMIGQLSERTGQLRKSEREGAWREMAKQVAHEIKNPLTPMKLSLQHLMRVRQADPQRAEEMMDQVSKSLITQIDDLAGIATAFSNFAQMPQAVNEQFSLNGLCRSVAQLYSGHDAGFSSDICDEEVVIDADPALIRRALTNLIENGLQAVPSDRKAALHFELGKADKQAFIKVKDNGNGIPDEISAKIFQPNFTTKSSGMGLGLAMTRNIITGAGGDIDFKTTQGEGTEFRIILPCQ